MKKFTEAQKETLKNLIMEVNRTNREWKIFVDYLIKEYQVDDKWELTLDGFKEKKNETK